MEYTQGDEVKTLDKVYGLLEAGEVLISEMDAVIEILCGLLYFDGELLVTGDYLNTDLKYYKAIEKPEEPIYPKLEPAELLTIANAVPAMEYVPCDQCEKLDNIIEILIDIRELLK